MAKPIKLTEDLITVAIKEFSNSLAKTKMANGMVRYNKDFTYKDVPGATILFTPEAYTKMIKLLMDFDSEVAWHGVGDRIGETDFLISDILVYPQTVTGSTVQMDTELYATWLMDNIDDDRFNHIIMQGHSHVNMGTSPSSVDVTHQEEILHQLTDDMYYIFMIWNKKLEHTTKIYDLKNNTLYENKDILYGILGSEFDLDKFIGEAKGLVKKDTCATSTKSGYSGYDYYSGKGYSDGYSGYKGKSSAQSKKKGNTGTKETKVVIGGGWRNRGTEDMDDEGYDYYSDRFDT